MKVVDFLSVCDDFHFRIFVEEKERFITRGLLLIKYRDYVIDKFYISNDGFEPILTLRIVLVEQKNLCTGDCSKCFYEFICIHSSEKSYSGERIGAFQFKSSDDE